MRILHIGDFHFRKSGNKYDQKEMIQKLAASIKDKSDIDFICFTGDLVQSGVDLTDFGAAYSALLVPTSTAANTELTNIFICPGNHDINRNECGKGTIQYFDRDVITNDQIDAEIKNQTKDYLLSLTPSKNYNDFAQKRPSLATDIHRDLFSVFVRSYKDKKVGILSINTAWLSSGFRDDEKKLAYPISELKKAIDILKENQCTHKIILLHHPISWLKDENGIELEHLINSEFNLKLSGHIHREDIATRFSGSNGIYSSTTQATLTYDTNGQIGYSILEYEIDEANEEGHQSLIVHRSSYNKQERQFVELESVEVSIPCGIEKASQNKLRRKIIEKYKRECSAADQLLLDYDTESTLGFLETFTQPLLSTRESSSTTDRELQSKFDYTSLCKLDSNYLIFGPDKCGKTSLLRWIELYYIKSYSDLGIVPLFMDLRDYTGQTKINFLKQLISFYEINRGDAEKILSEGRLLLILDNWDANASYRDDILNMLANNSHCQFIIATEYLASKVFLEELGNLKYKRLYFSNLTRKEIRLYTDKHPSLSDPAKQDDVIEKITKVCKQLQLPMNYWTVSLILLIYKKSNEDYNKNLFGILDLCVDEILQKKRLVFLKNHLTFQQYKELCARLAYRLLTNHKDTTYSAKSIQIITYLEEFIEPNPRLSADSANVFQYFIEVGLLKEKDGLFTFRLNGIFEYFLAYYIHSHPDFKKEILAKDSVYIVFKNELEIYSGLKSDDEVFLKEIFEKTKGAFDDIINEYLKDASHDAVLTSKYIKTSEITAQAKKLQFSDPLKREIRDAVQDVQDPLNTQAEVHIKEDIVLDKTNPEVLEIYLSILSKVFRNVDNVSDHDLVYQIFDYIIDAYCTFGYLLIDRLSSNNMRLFSESASHESYEIEHGTEVLRLMTNIIPVLTETLIFDGIGNVNIKKVIKNRIDEYKVDAKNNQYKLFILYFLLIDIDLKGEFDKINEVFDLVKLNPLKISTYTKLNFYFGFKTFTNRELEASIKRKITEAQFRIDDDIDSSELNRQLTSKDKSKLAHRVQQKG